MSRVFNRELLVGGKEYTIGSTRVRVITRENNKKVLLASGATVPTDATAGYCKGCIFVYTDGGVGTTLYINEGTSTSCDFNAVETPASIAQFNEAVTVGVDDTGYDVKFFGATSGKYWLWDESADKMIVVGDSQFTGAVTVGVDDTGHDVKLFGATASAYLLWDESADALVFAGNARIDLSSCTIAAGNTDGGVIKGGTSSARITEDTAGMKFISFYFDDGATSGESIGKYIRLYVTGAGGSGQTFRSFCTVEDVAAGNAYGAHISVSFGTTGSITGLGNALATTLHIPGAMSAGTYASQTVEIWADAAASDLAGATSKSFLRVGIGGDGTGIALMDDTINLFDFYGVTAGSGNMIDTDITTHTAYGGLRVNIPGVGVRYIALVSA